MRIPLVILLALGMALVVVGALNPALFVLSLVGMVVLAGTASVGIAALMQSEPRAHH